MQNKQLSGDLFGGITAGIVALPLALAFGVQSGLGAIAGLYGAIALGIVAALLGGTKTQVSGPTGPMTVVSAAVVMQHIATYGSLDAAMGAIIATFMLAGVFQIGLGLLRIGNYIKYMPYPVVSGFMSGIGMIIIILQIFPFLGHSSPKKIVDVFIELPNVLSAVNFQAVGLTLATIATIYLFPRLSKRIPSPLVALIALTVVATALNLNVMRIGEIPTGLPELHLETLLGVDWIHLMSILVPALTLAALGAIDSLLTSVVADNMTKTQHDSNRELLGQGVGNMAAGIIGGIPGAGATMRTVVNINSGGTTRLSGAIHGVALLVVLFGAGSYAQEIPMPVLAGILITVGIGIIDYKGIRHVTKVPRSDAAIMIIVLVITVFDDLLEAVAIGMVMASVLFMKQISDITEDQTRVGSVDEHLKEEPWADELELADEVRHNVYIKHFDGPIFFGFVSRLTQLSRSLPDVCVVIFRMEKVPYIDQSGLYAIEEAVLTLEKRGITVVMTGANTQVTTMFRSIRLVPIVIEESHLYADFMSCIEDLQSHAIHVKNNPDDAKSKFFWRYR